VLLLDEPAAGLSLNRIDTIKSLILRINRELGVTVLLVEHVLNLVLEVSEKVTVLNAGKLLAEGSPKEIRENPAVREAYLGKRH
jgi:branched-chain amino acid transport system ATP-binding protein